MEADEAFEWYDQRNPSAAQAFKAELSVAVDRVRRAPGRPALYRAGTRRVLLAEYPYAIAYWERPDRVQGVAVAHRRRKPGYWRRRRRRRRRLRLRHP